MTGLSRLAIAAAMVGTALALAGPASGAAAPAPAITVFDQFVVEGIPGQKSVSVDVTLSRPADVTVRVQWRTVDGTATAATGDYAPASGAVAFTPGITSRQVSLQLLGDDIPENDETFHLLLSRPGGGAIIADGTADILVIDDDHETGDATSDSIPGKPRLCPDDDRCRQFVVHCEGVPPVRALVARAIPTAPFRGVIVLFTGANGDTYWGFGNESVVDDMQGRGFEVDRVSWPDGWGEIAQGPTGVDIAGCRPATITDHLYETRYLHRQMSFPLGMCGFCVGGNSAGALQAVEGLANYGLDTIIDAAILTSGPAAASLAEGCLGVPEFAFEDVARWQLDLSYAVTSDDGPCLTEDPDFEATWREDSLNDGADDYFHPTTRMAFIQGGRDTTTTPPGVDIYIDHLLGAGSPRVTKTIYPDASHGLKTMLDDPEARAGIVAAFAYVPPTAGG